MVFRHKLVKGNAGVPTEMELLEAGPADGCVREADVGDKRCSDEVGVSTTI